MTQTANELCVCSVILVGKCLWHHGDTMNSWIIRELLEVARLSLVVEVCGVDGEEDGREDCLLRRPSVTDHPVQHTVLQESAHTVHGHISLWYCGLLCQTGSQQSKTQGGCPPASLLGRIQIQHLMVLKALERSKKGNIEMQPGYQ